MPDRQWKCPRCRRAWMEPEDRDDYYSSIQVCPRCAFRSGPSYLRGWWEGYEEGLEIQGKGGDQP